MSDSEREGGANGGGKTHELKCHPAPFQALLDETKTFELRHDDRGFVVGDRLWLREFNPDSGDTKYTGRETHRRVTYILRGPSFGLPEGFVVMAVRPCLCPRCARWTCGGCSPHAAAASTRRCDETT